METVSDGVHRLGSYWVNFYLVEEKGGVTVVDTGLPAYSDQIESGLEQLGRKMSDIKAVVLTHSHTDHLGCAPFLVDKTGAPVLAPAGEAKIVTGDAKPVPPKGVISSMWRATMWRFLGHAAANNGMSNVKLDEVTPYDGDQTLDVPGKFRVLSTPGHSAAHSSLVVGDTSVLICGDAMATLAVNTGATGPMIHPFNEDTTMAIESLAVLETSGAEIVLPGHGEPWRGAVPDAVAEARRRAG